MQNGTVGIAIGFWSSLAIYYGTHIKTMLKSGGTSDAEAKKIGNFCKGETLRNPTHAQRIHTH